MALSKENIEKLVMGGLYKHEPDKKYRDSLYWDKMYYCFNWTFMVVHHEDTDKWYMVDTFFNEFDKGHIELTDENFNEFEFMFRFGDVERHSGKNITDYNESDWRHVAVDSSGKKYFVRKGAVKEKERVLNRIQDEINELERQIKLKKKDYEAVFNDEVNPNHI